MWSSLVIVGSRAVEEGLETVPVIRLLGLTVSEQRALMLADNRIAENSDWDLDRLQKVLQGLVDVSFEVEDLGFDFAEIDRCLGNDAAPGLGTRWNGLYGSAVQFAHP